MRQLHLIILFLYYHIILSSYYLIISSSYYHIILSSYYHIILSGWMMRGWGQADGWDQASPGHHGHSWYNIHQHINNHNHMILLVVKSCIVRYHGNWNYNFLDCPFLTSHFWKVYVEFERHIPMEKSNTLLWKVWESAGNFKKNYQVVMKLY